MATTRRDRDNLADQTKIVEIAAKVLKYDFRLKIEKKDAYFAEFYRGKTLHAYAIVKDRTPNGYSSKSFKTWYVSKDKFEEADKLARKADVPLWAVVQWTDGIFYTQLDGVDWPTGINGRKDRTGNPNDIQEVIYVPVAEFIRLTGDDTSEQRIHRKDTGRGAADTFL
jgi:hypothetical protein